MKPRFERFICRAIPLLILLLLAGCRQAAIQDHTQPPEPTPTQKAIPADPLEGTTWVLLTLRGERLLEGTRIILEFSGGFIRGFAGCNEYGRAVIGDDVAGAKYKAGEDGSLTVPRLSITALDCPTPEGVVDQEKAYLGALRSAAAYRLVDDRLEIQDAAGETILVYARRAECAEEPANLAGTVWQLISVDGQVPVEGPATTLAFLDEKWFVEYSRCEGIVSSYQTAGHDLGSGFSAWLGQVCQDGEGRGVTTLRAPADYCLTQGRLQIATTSGQVFVYEPLPEAARLALEGPTWSLLSIVGERQIAGETVPIPDPNPILEGSEITLTFKGGGASGSAGCNSYGAAYILDGTSLAFGDIAATERDCPTPEGVGEPVRMEQEQRYLAALKDVTGYRMAGSQFWLLTDDGRALTFAVQGSK